MSVSTVRRSISPMASCWCWSVPSGCGKSTLLRLIAGLEEATGGTIHYRRARRDAPGAPRSRHRDGVPELRPVPAHDGAGEPGLRLEAARTFGAEVAERVKEAADRLELDVDARSLAASSCPAASGSASRWGGRWCDIRKVFLLDEPLSNLDAKLRAAMRTEIARLHRSLKTTMMYVTHDQVEAMTLGQRIVVLDRGIVQQIDTPMNIYERPVNLFVAGFLGNPAMNFFRGTLHGADQAHWLLQGEGAELPVRRRTAGWDGLSSSASGRKICTASTARARRGIFAWRAG